jgi:hypothetical protein
MSYVVRESVARFVPSLNSAHLNAGFSDADPIFVAAAPCFGRRLGVSCPFHF